MFIRAIIIFSMLVSCNVVKMVTQADTDVPDDFYDGGGCNNCSPPTPPDPIGLEIGLVAFWNFNNAGSVGDEYTTSFNMTISGAATSTDIPNASGNSLACEFGASSLTAPNFPSMSDYTISFWVNTTGTADEIMDFHGTDIEFHALSGGPPDIQLLMHGQTKGLNSVTANTWVHFSYIFRDVGGSHDVLVYINGVKVDENPTGGLTNLSGVNFFYLCQSQALVASTILIDSLGIWERELTATEITELAGGNTILD